MVERINSVRPETEGGSRRESDHDRDGVEKSVRAEPDGSDERGEDERHEDRPPNSGGEQPTKAGSRVKDLSGLAGGLPARRLTAVDRRTPCLAVAGPRSLPHGLLHHLDPMEPREADRFPTCAYVRHPDPPFAVDLS